MREHEVNKLDNFIGGWYIDNQDLLDYITMYFKFSPDKTEGRHGTDYTLDKSIKNSWDLTLSGDLLHRYTDELQKVTECYIEKYPFCNAYSAWTMKEPPNIQWYPAGGGFYIWHTERGHPYIATRHLVFMTYLNDMENGGETEFFHQKIKIKPEKGLTLIWPVDWTFTHRGLPSSTEEKYIVTGWYSLYEKESK